MKSKGGGTLLKDTAGVSGHFKTPSLELGQKLWNESVPKLWDQSRLMWRFCRSEDYKVFGICLVCKLTTTEDFVLKAVACNKYASEGLQCSYRACWAWKMTDGIFCQGIFYILFLLSPGPGGPAVYPAHGQTLYCWATLPEHTLYLHFGGLRLFKPHCSSSLWIVAIDP